MVAAWKGFGLLGRADTQIIEGRWRSDPKSSARAGLASGPPSLKARTLAATEQQILMDYLSAVPSDE